MADHEKRLLTVKELREALGRDRVSDHTAYALARVYGVRLGKRLLVPAHVVEMVLRGEFDHERVNLEARKRRKWEGGGR
ncbi:hypothetical protein [Fervidobacterium sp.]